ncbi:MAG TPA: hypothetical protein VGP51_01020 [Nocardioidaceae bacterium]|jgi:hypothetical protein|nr:hypothetical protein [Actinomycetota bacterium]MDQ3423903.1 hypothetical protein [Actinomycetota bacterium]HEV8055050.1 hypothetical protein [Nocardioidaceae bacterium]
MIVRILNEGQWELGDDRVDALNELDASVEHAIEAGDEGSFRTSLAALLAGVRGEGTPVELDRLVDSDLVLPPGDASLEEVRNFLSDEGLIPG